MKESLELDEYKIKKLGIEQGMKFEVCIENGQPIFTGVVSKLDEDSLWISNVNGGNVPSVIYNSKIRLKGFSANNINILYGVICGSSALFWKINKISKQSYYNARDYYRQPVSIETKVERIDFADSGNEDKKKMSVSALPCKILNISGSGLLISSKEKYSVGTMLEFCNLSLIPDHAPFCLKCRILRMEENDKEYFYGCKFEEMDKKVQERLVQEIFMLQRIEIKRQNGQNSEYD